MDFTTNFESELQQAQYFEQRTKEIYESLGYTVEMVSEISTDRKYYDLKVTKDNQTQYIEVKFDLTAKIGRDGKPATGNLYFELESRGKLSGLSTTHANIWIQWIDDNTYFVFTDLKRLRSELRSLKLVAGGDNNSSYGKILAIDSIPLILSEDLDCGLSKAFFTKVS